MLRHHQLQGVLCVALTVTALLLTRCTQDRIEPAPVSFRGINKTINSTAPMVATPLAPPQYSAPSALRAVTAEMPAAAHRTMPRDDASGGAVIKPERSASAHKMHTHRAPQMAGSGAGKSKGSPRRQIRRVSHDAGSLASREHSSRRAGYKLR